MQNAHDVTSRKSNLHSWFTCISSVAIFDGGAADEFIAERVCVPRAEEDKNAVDAKEREWAQMARA